MPIIEVKIVKSGHLVAILIFMVALVAAALYGANMFIAQYAMGDVRFLNRPFQENCSSKYEAHKSAYQAWFNDRKQARGPVLDEFEPNYAPNPESAPHWREGVLVNQAILLNEGTWTGDGDLKTPKTREGAFSTMGTGPADSKTLSDCGWTIDDVRSFARYLKEHVTPAPVY